MHIVSLVSFSNYLTWLYVPKFVPLLASSSPFYATSVQFLNRDSTVTQGYSVFSICVLQYILQ